MAAVETVASAARVPGPAELLPGKPDAVIDLQTEAGLALVGGQWRYSDCTVEEIDFVELGSPEDPLGPGTVPNRTYDVLPHAEGADYDDTGWRALAQLLGGAALDRPAADLAACEDRGRPPDDVHHVDVALVVLRLARLVAPAGVELVRAGVEQDAGLVE